MKQYIKSLLLVGMCIPALTYSISSLDTEVSGRSFLAVEPNFHSSSPELISGFRNDRTHKREDGWHGAAQFAIFGGRSRHSLDLARYFFPNGKTSLIVGEIVAQPNSVDFPDILASNLNIFTTGDNFKSRITIRPQQSVVGGAIHYRQSFYRCEEKCRGWWFDILLPISRVRNHLNFTEEILNTTNDNTPRVITGLTTYGSAITAFNQPAFMYGKINDCASQMRRTGVSDMEFKLGYEWLDCYEQGCHLESYLGIVAPTSRQDDAEYLFEAVNGYNKHWGIIWGGSAGIEIWRKEENDQSLRLETTSNSRYLFKKNQLRTLDIMNKPWSRYITVYANLAQAQAAAVIPDPTLAAAFNTPGINVFTRSVSVTPGFAYDQNTAIVYNRNRMQAEAGYNFFARRSERIALKCSETNPALLPAIKDLVGVGTTNPIRDITGNIFLNEATLNDVVPPTATLPVPLAQYSNSVIYDDQLNLASAATPNTLEHTVYGAVGCNYDYRDYPLFGNFGASFTFSKSNNATMERWTLWGKLGVSF